MCLVRQAQRALCSQGPQDIHGMSAGHIPLSSAPRGTSLVPLTSGLTKGSSLLGEFLFCDPKPSCIAHSLVAEEHPGSGSSWTGAGSNTARDKSTGGILGRMMHHTGSGLLSSLLFAFSLQSQTFELGLWSSNTQMPSGLLYLPPPAHPFCLTLLPQSKAAMPWAQ